MKISGWGQYPKYRAKCKAPRNISEIQNLMKLGPLIARGNGRAYGDSAINSQTTLQTKHLNRFISFNEKTGQLVVEAGVLAADIIDSFLDRGWFLPVTPGTKFVSVGGMVAADVHGKNHHAVGSFSSFVDWVLVLTEDGQTVKCSKKENRELFLWTLGGMGLTGIILQVAFRLSKIESAWIRQTTRPAKNLAEAIEIFEDNQDVTYSVAWIDCLAKGDDLGRSLVMLGEHARLTDLDHAKKNAPFETKKKAAKTVPFTPPIPATNKWSVTAFNALYFRNGVRNQGTTLVDWDSFFYPLDSILKWNRIYGRKGFVQFQCVLPLENSRDGLHALVEEISNSGVGSFLAVLKRMGKQTSKISFPMEGYTLALDFPVSSKVLKLLDVLDQITLEHSGRFYLAKDARMSAATYADSDARVEKFKKLRKDMVMDKTFVSEQSNRLKL